MVERNEKLIYATITTEGQIFIYKLDSSKMNWINMTNLDYKILYLVILDPG